MLYTSRGHFREYDVLVREMPRVRSVRVHRPGLPCWPVAGGTRSTACVAAPATAPSGSSNRSRGRGLADGDADGHSLNTHRVTILDRYVNRCDVAPAVGTGCGYQPERDSRRRTGAFHLARLPPHCRPSPRQHGVRRRARVPPPSLQRSHVNAIAGAADHGGRAPRTRSSARDG